MTLSIKNIITDTLETINSVTDVRIQNNRLIVFYVPLSDADIGIAEYELQKVVVQVVE